MPTILAPSYLLGKWRPGWSPKRRYILMPVIRPRPEEIQALLDSSGKALPPELSAWIAGRSWWLPRTADGNRADPLVTLVLRLLQSKDMAVAWRRCKTAGVNPVHVVTAALAAFEDAANEQAREAATVEAERWDDLGKALGALQTALRRCPLPGMMTGPEDSHVIVFDPARTPFRDRADILQRPMFVDLPQLLEVLDQFAKREAGKSEVRFAKKQKRRGAQPAALIFCRSMALLLAEEPDNFELNAVIGRAYGALFDKRLEPWQVRDRLEGEDFQKMFLLKRESWRKSPARDDKEINPG